MIQQSGTKCVVPEVKPAGLRLNWGKFPTDPNVASPPRVLVTEDDPRLRDLMVQTMAFEGFFVTEASDAFAMLNAVKACHEACDDTFDLIVTDVRMPGLSGLDALARLRESGCQTPAIVVSALPRDMIQDQVQRLNALFIAKPFALDSLRKAANQAIYGQQNRTSGHTRICRP